MPATSGPDIPASALAAPAPPWRALDADSARQLPADELRLLWIPASEQEAPRRQRIDALLRRALAPLLSLAPAQLEFGREHKGRPFLRHAGAPDFNLSDTQGGTLLAITHAARVGVDLERRDRQPPATRLAARWFAAEEARALSTLPTAQAAREFIWLWTAKEASCKATGTGIFGFLPQWRFEPGSEQPRLRGLPEDAGDAARWRLLRLAPSAEHTAVIAMRDASPELRLRCWQMAAAPLD